MKVLRASDKARVDFEDMVLDDDGRVLPIVAMFDGEGVQTTSVSECAVVVAGRADQWVSAAVMR